MTDTRPEVLPFGQPCRACLSITRDLRFCTTRCTQVGIGAYDVTARIGDVDWPHLHATCKICGFQWLEQPLGFSAEESSCSSQ